MRALELHSLEGPDGLVLVERPDPHTDDGVVIDVRAAGVSFPDLLISQGRYQTRAELPWVPGLEVSGVVRSAPPGSDLRPGERVWASLERGGFASVAVADAKRTYRLPDALTFAQGAALGVNFRTAVFALRRRGALRAGEDVLVLGAAGGLGSACVSVAKAYGARVIAAVSTGDKAATARAAGADDVLVGGDLRDQVLAGTSGRGVDVVADVVGGEATVQAVRCTAAEGRVLILGFTSGEIPLIPGNRLLLRNVSVVGVGLGAFAASDPAVLRDTATEVLELIEGATLRPVLGASYPLEDGAEALRALARRTAQGKLVLLI